MAVIDIGSNGLRLAFGHSGLIIENFNLRYPLRLGTDSFGKGYISLTTRSKLIIALSLFQKIIAKEGIKYIKVIATSALREANNSDEIINFIENKIQMNIELISGVEEAKILFSAIKKYYTPPKLGKTLVMDIGGGSVELISYKSKKIKARSLKSGTVRLLTHSKNNLNIWNQIIEKQLFLNRKKLEKINANYLFIGTGGNVRSLGKLAYYLGISNRLDRLSHASVLTCLSLLANLTPLQRQRQLGLKDYRADVILPATLIIHNIMEKFNLSYIHIPNVGLRNGLFLK